MPTPERGHRADCPGLAAWDIPEACNCDRPTVDEILAEHECQFYATGHGWACAVHRDCRNVRTQGLRPFGP